MKTRVCVKYSVNVCSSNIKKIHIFPQKKAYIYGNETLHCSAQARKIKKFHLGKISYASAKGNPEKTPYIFSKESASYVSRNGKPKKPFYISGNRSPEATSYILGTKKELSSLRLKKNFLYFWRKFQSLKIKQEAIPKNY